MGYMRHHAIVVTSYDLDKLTLAREIAVDIFPYVSLLSPTMNHYHSFFIPPDGSKEGWAESEDGDKQRDSFIAWLHSQRFADNSTWLDWVEIQYGDDERETIVTRHSDEVPLKED